MNWLLAQATEQVASGGADLTLRLVEIIALLVVGGGGTAAGMQVKRRLSNGNGNGYNKALCEDRHKRIDDTFTKIETKMEAGFERIYDKLDAMHDQRPPGVQT